MASPQLGRDDESRRRGRGDHIAAVLQQTRLAKELTQAQVADRAGMHRNQISNLERNHSNREPFLADPTVSTLATLAEVLDIDVAEFVTCPPQCVYCTAAVGR